MKNADILLEWKKLLASGSSGLSVNPALPITLADLEHARADIIKLVSQTGCKKLLMDHRESTIAEPLMPDRSVELALMYTDDSLSETIAEASVASIHPTDPESRAKLRQLSRMAASRGIDVQMFDDRDSALQWLAANHNIKSREAAATGRIPIVRD